MIVSEIMSSHGSKTESSNHVGTVEFQIPSARVTGTGIHGQCAHRGSQACFCVSLSGKECQLIEPLATALFVSG